MNKYNVSLLFDEDFEAESEFEAEQLAIQKIEAMGCLRAELIEDEEDAD